MIDKLFCMSSYLMYRYVYDEKKTFTNSGKRPVDIGFKRLPVVDAESLDFVLRSIINNKIDKETALALSGGMDSAILARMVPHGTKAYTFRCVVEGMEVVDESEGARKWAELNNLDHEVIDICWEDVIRAADVCMKHKGAPIHSIETQIYLASRKAYNDGYRKFIFGENADIIYGGMDGLIAKDWLFSEFVDRYTYVMPYKALVEPKMPLDPFWEFEKDGHIDGHCFINKYFRQEALGTYINACEAAGMEFFGPYSLTDLDVPLDFKRIRSGDTKYIIRELFGKLYPGIEAPKKVPMPRPVSEWFRNWNGPKRAEFIPHCTDNMTGDQKWMVWCLERYLNNIED